MKRIQFQNFKYATLKQNLFLRFGFNFSVQEVVFHQDVIKTRQGHSF